MAGKGKPPSKPGDLLLQVEREAVIRRATAISILPAPEGVAIAFEAGAIIETYLTLDAATGGAFTKYVIERAGEKKVLEARLPEGLMILDVEVQGEGSVVVLRRRADAPRPPATPPAPPPVAEAPAAAPLPEPEAEEELGMGSPEESGLVTLVNKILNDTIAVKATGFRIDPSFAPPPLPKDPPPSASPEVAEVLAKFAEGTPPDPAECFWIQWEGVDLLTAPFPTFNRNLMGPILRRLLILAGLSFTRKTEGVIKFRTVEGALESFRVSRTGTSDHDAIHVERQTGAGDAAVSSPATAAPKRAYSGTVIGHVRTSVRDDVDDGWGKVESEIVIDAKLASGLKGLDGFSHAVVVFWMERSTFADADLVRRPRGREDMPPAGIFAQRAKHRPNPIGITAVKIESVDVEKGILRVKGLDAIDGTPVLDVKPYVPAFDRVENARVPGWMDVLMKGYFS